MKTAFLLILLIAMTGCAMSPRDLRDRSLKGTTQTNLPPERAAYCMQRNLENAGGEISARVAPLDGGAYEVTARTDLWGVFEIYEFRPEAASGMTRVNIWIATNLDKPGFEPWREAQALLKNCR